MDPLSLLVVYSTKFSTDYKAAGDKHWLASLWASRVVGKYGRGDTMRIAKESGVSVDTVEDHAHAYQMFEGLCGLGLEHRKFTFAARRATFIHYSHFRALYDAREKYDLSWEQCFDILMDIVQAEGDISSRDVDTHAQGRFGKEPSWEYHAQKAMKEINKVLIKYPSDGDRTGKEVLTAAYNWIGENV